MSQVPVQYNVVKSMDYHARVTGQSYNSVLDAFNKLQSQMFAAGANFKAFNKALERAAKGKHWTEELEELYEQIQLGRQENEHGSSVGVQENIR